MELTELFPNVLYIIMNLEKKRFITFNHFIGGETFSFVN